MNKTKPTAPFIINPNKVTPEEAVQLNLFQAQVTNPEYVAAVNSFIQASEEYAFSKEKNRNSETWSKLFHHHQMLVTSKAGLRNYRHATTDKD